MKHYFGMRVSNLELQWTVWVTNTECWVKKARHLRVHIVGFCLFKGQREANLIFSIWSQDGSWMGVVADAWNGAWGAFWDAVHVLALQLGPIIEVCSLCVISLSCMVDLCVLQCVLNTSNKSLHEVKKKKASWISMYTGFIDWCPQSVVILGVQVTPSCWGPLNVSVWRWELDMFVLFAVSNWKSLGLFFVKVSFDYFWKIPKIQWQH